MDFNLLFLYEKLIHCIQLSWTLLKLFNFQRGTNIKLEEYVTH